MSQGSQSWERGRKHPGLVIPDSQWWWWWRCYLLVICCRPTNNYVFSLREQVKMELKTFTSKTTMSVLDLTSLRCPTRTLELGGSFSRHVHGLPVVSGIGCRRQIVACSTQEEAENPNETLQSVDSCTHTRSQGTKKKVFNHLFPSISFIWAASPSPCFLLSVSHRSDSVA